MSVIEYARSELKRVNFDPDESKVMIDILEKFFDTWDSGGAVFFVAPVLQKLIACKPLSPLTGEDDEWMEVGDQNGGPLYQSIRCPTVFKDKDGAYDIAGPGPRRPITFPYDPENIQVDDPVITI